MRKKSTFMKNTEQKNKEDVPRSSIAVGGGEEELLVDVSQKEQPAGPGSKINEASDIQVEFPSVLFSGNVKE